MFCIHSSDYSLSLFRFVNKCLLNSGLCRLFQSHTCPWGNLNGPSLTFLKSFSHDLLTSVVFTTFTTCGNSFFFFFLQSIKRMRTGSVILTSHYYWWTKSHDLWLDYLSFDQVTPCQSSWAFQTKPEMPSYPGMLRSRASVGLMSGGISQFLNLPSRRE